jgi:hypothetical protein
MVYLSRREENLDSKALGPDRTRRMTHRQLDG